MRMEDRSSTLSWGDVMSEVVETMALREAVQMPMEKLQIWRTDRPEDESWTLQRQTMRRQKGPYIGREGAHIMVEFEEDWESVRRMESIMKAPS